MRRSRSGTVLDGNVGCATVSLSSRMTSPSMCLACTGQPAEGIEEVIQHAPDDAEIIQAHDHLAIACSRHFRASLIIPGWLRDGDVGLRPWSDRKIMSSGIEARFMPMVNSHLDQTWDCFTLRPIGIPLLFNELHSPVMRVRRCRHEIVLFVWTLRSMSTELVPEHPPSGLVSASTPQTLQSLGWLLCIFKSPSSSSLPRLVSIRSQQARAVQCNSSSTFVHRLCCRSRAGHSRTEAHNFMRP